MAEYYPLLAKAVASLKDAPPETRHAVYDRARKALMNQLRGLDPPAAEADVERECQSLDEAVARIETEMGAPATAVAGPMPLPSAPSEARPLTMRPPRPAPAGSFRPTPAPAASPAEPAAPEDVTETTIVQPGPPLKREAAAAAAEAGKEAGKGRLEPQRPFAPQPPEPRPSGRRLWIVSAVVAVIVAVVAVAAWRLRDRPEDLAKLRPAASSQQSDAGNGKIVDRVGGGPRPDQPVSAQRADEQAQTNAAPAAPTLPVSQRAALLVEAPDEPNKMKTFLGLVVWRRDNVAAGPGQPLTTAVRADVDIPDDKLQTTMIFQKNSDASLPASHTMKITFTVGAGSPTGGVRQISVPQMRREETMAGESLSGVPVPIMENSFLVGLSRGNNENTNLDLVKTREWVDIPIMLTSGKIAKLTFEKGLSGQRAIDDALAAWQSPQ